MRELVYLCQVAYNVNSGNDLVYNDDLGGSSPPIYTNFNLHTILMKKLFYILLLISNTVYAEMEKSAYEKYSTQPNVNKDVKIKWVVVDNIQKTCDGLRKKQTGKKFGYALDACSTWKTGFFSNECTIITGKMVNNDIIGHELRHCFQGNFHQ